MEHVREHIDLKNTGIYLMFVTGMRIGELAALKREDVDPEECTVRIIRTESRKLGNGCIEQVYVRDFPKTKAGIRRIVVPEKHRWILKELLRIGETTMFSPTRKAESKAGTSERDCTLYAGKQVFIKNHLIRYERLMGRYCLMQTLIEEPFWTSWDTQIFMLRRMIITETESPLI